MLPPEIKLNSNSIQTQFKLKSKPSSNSTALHTDLTSHVQEPASSLHLQNQTQPCVARKVHFPTSENTANGPHEAQPANGPSEAQPIPAMHGIHLLSGLAPQPQLLTDSDPHLLTGLAPKPQHLTGFAAKYQHLSGLAPKPQPT
jgi:hypothetical protein